MLNLGVCVCVQEKEAKRVETKRRRGAFRELLERSKFVRHDTAWRKAQDRLAGEREGGRVCCAVLCCAVLCCAVLLSGVYF